jgi:hypothetical protein
MVLLCIVPYQLCVVNLLPLLVLANPLALVVLIDDGILQRFDRFTFGRVNASILNLRNHHLGARLSSGREQQL